VAVPIAGAPLGALPVPATALVGRDVELAELSALLAAPGTRLVTLTGPPGVGKTRLAVAAAAAVADRFADGVVFVDLTAVRDPALVPSAVAAALGSRTAAADGLARALTDRELLLVLDNVEHVLAAAPALAVPLAACPALRLLATSRERLDVAAEQELPVPPLALPDDGSGDDGDLARFARVPAVALLLARIRAHQPGYEVTNADRAALAEICARLDGLPLAIELAAARLRLFTPAELAFRLRQRLGAERTDLLGDGPRDAPDRHRTLRTALSWSHDLLGPRERSLFRRLSVFVGGCTVDAAVQVCGGEVEVLASLADKSLVRRRSGPAAGGAVSGFTMLESLREFAAEQLARHDEVEATRERHARYFAAWAERTEARIGTAEEWASVADVGFEEGNLRAALEHTTSAGDVARGPALAAALGWHAYTRGRLGEGCVVLDTVLAAAAAEPARVPDDALAAALMIAGVLALAAGEPDRSEALLERSARTDPRSRRRAAIVTAFRGHLARTRGRHGEAADHFRRAAELHAALGNTAGVAWSRYDLGLLARRRGDLAGAVEHLRSALEAFREMGYRWAVGCTAWPLAAVELTGGRTEVAAALLGEALNCAEEVDDARGLAHCMEVAAAVTLARGDPEGAIGLLGAAAALRHRLAAPLPDEERAAVHAAAARARRALGPEAADRARLSGRGLSRAAAVALARRAVVAPAAARPEPAGGLTPRERQVADLVAAGCTNRQIGRRLGIAEKTTEVHVHHIIRKLGARSRAEVAAWAARTGMPEP